jgi:hypothetical protein
MTMSRVYSHPSASRRSSGEGTEFEQAKLMFFATLLCAMPAAFDLSREAAALGLGALTLLPVIIISLRTGRLLIADPLVVVGIMWFLAVTLPVLVQLVDASIYRDPVWYKTTPWALDTATLWMYRGWAACCGVYWAARVLLRPTAARHRMGPRDRDYESRMRLMIGGLGLLGSIAFMFMTGGQSYSHIEGFATTSSLGMVVEEMRVFAVLYVFLYFRAKNLGRLANGEGYMLLAILSGLALIFAASSSKGLMLQVAAASVLGNGSGAQHSRLLKELAIGGAALLVVYSTFYVVTVYRLELRTRPLPPDAPFSEVIGLQLDAITVAVSALIEGRSIEDNSESYDSGNMLDRLALMSAFGMVLDYTGGYSPNENAWESLAAPILAFIPRDLVGEKVQFMNSGKFAQLQGWEFGGLSLTTAGSLFWAWDFEGIIFGMMVLGIIMAALVSWSALDGLVGSTCSALMVRLVVMMLDVGADFQPLLTGLMRSAMFVVLIHFVARAFGVLDCVSRMRT